MKIYVIHNNTGSRFYRLIPQLKYMQEQGHQIVLESHDDPNMDAYIKWADVIIFQMVLDLNRVKWAKAHGKKVIFECDDLIHIVPPTHYNYQDIKGIKNRINWWRKLMPILRRCDGFISTNVHLDRKYGIFAKDSLVFDNYIDLTHWLKEYKENKSDEVRLLWAGSTSHTGDLHMIKPILSKILDKYPQVKFIYIGTGGLRTKDLNSQFIYGEDLFAGMSDNRESLLPMTANLYPYTLASLLADVAIAPLEKNYFNKFKSACKSLEYSINRIPAVYSGWFYQQTIINGKNGFLAETENDWITALSRLIESKDLRKYMGQTAYETAIKKHDITNHLQTWREFVEKIYANDSIAIKKPGAVQNGYSEHDDPEQCGYSHPAERRLL